MSAPTEFTEIPTWKERMPAPRDAFQCDMNCSGVGMGKVLEQSCGDCMPIKVYGDPIAARDAEITDLCAALAAPAIQTVDRNAVLEECAALAFQWGNARVDDGGGNALRNYAEAVRALKSAAPASVPPGDLSDDGIVEVLASFGIDADKSKYGFPELQVSTNIPGIRKIITAYLAAAQPAAQVAVTEAGELPQLFDLWWNARDVYLSITDYPEPGLVPMNRNSATIRALGRSIDETEQLCSEQSRFTLAAPVLPVAAPANAITTSDLIQRLRNVADHHANFEHGSISMALIKAAINALAGDVKGGAA